MKHFEIFDSQHVTLECDRLKSDTVITNESDNFHFMTSMMASYVISCLFENLLLIQ